MGETRKTRVLIIGSGPAGYTAAVYSARAMLEPILVQGQQPGGQLTITTEVENWPGRTEVQGPDLMVQMEEHARAMGAEVLFDTITELELSRRPFVALSPEGAPNEDVRRAMTSANRSMRLAWSASPSIGGSRPCRWWPASWP